MPLLRWLLQPLRRWIQRWIETARFRRKMQQMRLEWADRAYAWLVAEIRTLPPILLAVKLDRTRHTESDCAGQDAVRFIRIAE